MRTPVVAVVLGWGGVRGLVEQASGILKTYERSRDRPAKLTIELLNNQSWADRLGNLVANGLKNNRSIKSANGCTDWKASIRGSYPYEDETLLLLFDAY